MPKTVTKACIPTPVRSTHDLAELAEAMRDEADALIKDGEARLNNPYLDSQTRAKIREELKELYKLRRKYIQVMSMKE